MNVHRRSSAPHLHPASAWSIKSPTDDDLLLYASPDSSIEVALRRLFPGAAPFHSAQHTVAYILRGRARFLRDSGEIVEALPGSLLHFKQSWAGRVEVAETLELSCMTCPGAPSAETPVLRDVLSAAPLKDWGVIPTMLQGTSHTAGILLSRDPDNRAESGIWTCTPGTWLCEVTSDEYCHFLDGSCTYTHQSGENIEIEPDTLAFFPRGWKGPCEVRRTIRKVYLIR